MNSLDSAETMRLWTEILTSKSVNECTQDKEAVESSISLSQDQEVNDDDPDAHSVSFSQDQPADVDEFGTYPVSSSSDQAQIHEQTDDQFGYTDAENPDDVGKQSEHTAAERFDDENEDQRSDQSEQTYLAHHGDARSDQTYLSDHEDQNPDQEDQSPHEKPDLGDRPSILADQHSETSPNVKDKATQTDPVIISTLRPTNIDTSESSITRAMNGSRSSRSSSDNSEGLAPHSTDTKPRLQSPMLSGTLPPPSTPETLQDLTSVNVGISLLIVNELDGIKRLSMGESRHAPRNYTGRQTSPGQKWGLNNRYQTFASSASKADDSALNSRRPSPSPVRSGDPETRASATTVTLAKKAIDDEDETKRTSLSGSAESSSRPSLSPPFKHTDSETVAPATACPPPKPPTGDEENSGYCVENPTDHKSVHIEPLDNSSRNGKDEPKGTNLPPHLRHPEHVAETTQRNPIAEGNSISRSNQSEGWKEDHSTEESFTNRSDTAGIPQGDESTEKTSNNRSDLVEASQGDQSTEKTSINGSDLAEAPQGDQSTEGTSTRSGGRLNNEIPSVTSTQRPSTGELSKQKPDLTPSLGTLKAVPAPRIAKVAENREDQIFFDGWGTPEARVTPSARVRRVIIRNISDPDPSFVAAIVWGGVLDEIIIKTNSAEVIFGYAEDCDNFYRSAKKGIPYKRNNIKKIAFVEKASDVDVVGGLMQVYLERGFTRCVRATGVPASITATQLRAKATFKQRRLESIEDGILEATGLRYVIFRFCSIRDSVMFKKALEREEEWEHCNIQYHTDPCAAPIPTFA